MYGPVLGHSHLMDRQTLDYVLQQLVLELTTEELT